MLVAIGDWRKPDYIRQNKRDFYSKHREPLRGSEGVDPTTFHMTDDLRLTQSQTAIAALKYGLSGKNVMTKGLQRTAWIWAMGYLIRENITDWRVAVVFGTGPLEVTSTYTGFEALRQEMHDFEAAADELDDSELRADARRTMIAYYHVRTFRRITGQGNHPVAYYKGDALSTLVVGGGWTGIAWEVASLVFPSLRPLYKPLGMMEKMSAFTNAVSSISRDQREGTKNALIPVYSDPSMNLDADLKTCVEYLDVADGRELSIVGHYVAATNNHSRYIMLAVFLAALRLDSIYLQREVFYAQWKETSLAYCKRTAVPPACIRKPDQECEEHIEEAVSHLWEAIRAANKENTDDSISTAQRAYHRFVDEEVQGIYWRTKDPRVLWAVSAALYRLILAFPGISGLFMRGDEFKSLYVQTDIYEDEWLREIYASKPASLT